MSLHRPALLSLVLVWPLSAFAQGERDWREIAAESSLVVTARQVDGGGVVERPEMRPLTSFRDASGRERIVETDWGRAIVGRLRLFEVVQVLKPDTQVVLPGQVIRVFTERDGRVFRSDREYVLFLVRPFRPETPGEGALGPGGWMQLSGTVVARRTNAGETEEVFNPLLAYGFADVSAFSRAQSALDVSDSRFPTVSGQVAISQHIQRPIVSIATNGACESGDTPACTITFTASASDPEGDPMELEWSGCSAGSDGALTCTTNIAGPVEADVLVRDAAGAVSGARGGVEVFASQYHVEQWGPCVSESAWTCTATGPSGCTRLGERSRIVRESGLTLDRSFALARPEAVDDCTLTTEGYIESYSATYESSWTCTAAGPNGCSKQRQSYAVAAYGPTAPSAAIPATTIYSTGYVAGYSVGVWSECSAACDGGTQTRTVSANAWSADAPDVPSPPLSQPCNMQPCNSPPTVTVSGSGSCHPSPTCVRTLTVSASDPDGDPLTYTWNGAGCSGSGTSATVTLSAIQTYTCTVAVNDGRGGTTNASGTATATNATPVITWSGSRDGINCGSSACAWVPDSGGNFAFSVTDDDTATGATCTAVARGQCGWAECYANTGMVYMYTLGTGNCYVDINYTDRWGAQSATFTEWYPVRSYD